MRRGGALDERARKAGIARDWTDAAGVRRRVGDDTVAALLEALGEDEDAEDAPLVTAELGEPVRLPSGNILPPFGEPGYHDAGEIVVAVAPPRGWTIADAAPGRRIWGPAVQLPSLADGRREPFGDFPALAGFAAEAGAAGADAVAISPVHALFPADPSRFGPYGPSTRLFLNVLFADPGDEAAPPAAGDLIDWARAIPERMARLRRRHARRGEAEKRAASDFLAGQGEPLRLHAVYEALHAHFHRQSGARGWQDWPSAFHDPRSGAVAAFAREQAEEVDLFVFLQWLARDGLRSAQAAARGAGMAVGLIADLAVGLDAGGSQSWSRREAMLEGVSIGAPPDPLGPDGQNWGITGLSPTALRRTGFRDFIAILRAAMADAGGVRIDHAMGLKRLWVVPNGFAATEGAYLSYPEQDLMRLLALESWRARAVVVGEDLGTVPPGFRGTMASRGFLGMRVLWFERDSRGSFVPATRWDRAAAAMSSTHDLPTVAGWWSERDVDWTWRIGRTSAFASEEAERRARARDRKRLWRAIGGGARQPRRQAGGKAASAAIAFLATSACDLALIPAEDLLALEEQPNLPGTIDEHPNWRRRLPVPVCGMFDVPPVAARVASLNRERGQ